MEKKIIPEELLFNNYLRFVFESGCNRMSQPDQNFTVGGGKIF